VSTLETADVAALTTSGVAALTTAQIVALTTAQITSLSTAGVAALTTAQVVALTTAQIEGLTTAGVAALTTAQVATLTTTQVMALETRDVAALTTAQIVVMTTAALAALASDQVAALSTADAAALTTAQIVALTTAQASVLTSAQLQVLTTAQVVVFETRDLAAFSTDSISALTTSSIASLTTSAVAALTTSQIVYGLTSTQVSALTTTQVHALTSDQINAFATTSNFGSLALGSPIILDLNGNGVTTQSITAGVEFDLFAAGEKVHTGWVGGGDGFLVMDRNHDGVINDGGELFGQASLLASGEKAKDGYQALAELDSNQDGLITSADKGFADLSVWVDSNSDGVSQAGEIRTLDSLGVSQLDLAATTSWAKNNGNVEGLVSSYETTDGVKHAMADVWFVADKNENTKISATVSSAVVKTDGLSSQVGGLVQALGAFSEASSSVIDGVSTAMSGGKALVSCTATPASLSTSRSGIVDALKEFDSNGNAVANAGLTQRISATPTLAVSNPLSPSSGGILATGK
jgi:hypothetical protein